MHQILDEVTLKSGQQMDIVKTTAPEPDWTERIVTFLSHKEDFWLDAMRQCYDGGLDDVIMSDFLGIIDDDIVGNVTITEHQSVAILGHVFTSPEHRRQGIASALLEAVRADFMARGGRAMFLGTGYDSAPYHIYSRVIGFEGRGDSGKMTWLPDNNFHDTYFAPATVNIRDTRWEDWPKLEALYAVENQWQLKGYYFGQYGHGGYEGAYIKMRQAMDDGAIVDVKVMQAENGAVAGHCFLARHPQWQPRVLVLDLMAHENFYNKLGQLLDAIHIPAGGKILAFSDERAAAKMQALEAVGFKKEGTFTDQIEDQDHKIIDVHVHGLVT